MLIVSRKLILCFLLPLKNLFIGQGQLALYDVSRGHPISFSVHNFFNTDRKVSRGKRNRKDELQKSKLMKTEV